MKLNQIFFYTLRENVKDEDSKSGNLLVRGGFIKKTSAGVYMLMPLGLKVHGKIEQIIREEMNAIGSLELKMPSLISEDVYIQSGRRDKLGASMFALKDRFAKPFVLGPTHEELFAVAASMKVRSYKDLPISLYQFQTKFRDEPRPRFGLIRVREFVMKDAYTFDTSLENLGIAYDKMFNAYKNSFDKMGLDYKIVRADTGVMGGLLSEEFQAVSDIGEDTLVLCDHCDFSSNIEVAQCVNEGYPQTKDIREQSLVHTPNARTIEEVCAFLNETKEHFAKTIIYKIDEKPYACIVLGHREINETKLLKALNAKSIELADAYTVEEVTHAKVGFAGPVGIDCPIIMDQEFNELNYFITGANQTDYHLINVSKDQFTPLLIADIRNINEGDTCPVCGGKIYFKKGIEVGNTFKLGTHYAEVLGVNYTDQNNQLNPVWMGSYGIGPGRCMAAIVEQNADENGINWPLNIAPFEVAIVLINGKDEVQVELANTLYQTCLEKGIDVVLDDRDERAGVKFKDIELIGVPYRVTVGKKAVEQIVEFKARNDESNTEISSNEIVDHLLACIKK
ncbi:MAG: proline--tRNA ligase [Erysipelotrichaceae bacterium]